jgi:hypothetical protein
MSKPVEIDLGVIELSERAIEAISWVEGFPEGSEMDEEGLQAFLRRNVADLVNDIVDDLGELSARYSDPWRLK